MSSKAKKESSKTIQKKKEKIIEDKTFGLKNKKGSKQQKFIKNVTNQLANDPNTRTKKATKDTKDDKLDEFNKIFKPVVQEQKVTQGVDPKFTLCAFFKQGLCTKGDKCKFSHDLAVERKVEKRSLYVDLRENETMENWDENKLEEVVNKKHSEENKRSNKTDIICKHFLKAVEENKYGWFWECPDGGDKCIYRHALPPGFTLLNRRGQKNPNAADKENMPLLEELLDSKVGDLDREKVHTKLTLESFRGWKESRLQQKRANARAQAKEREDKYRAGKGNVLTGRELFMLDPSLIQVDELSSADVLAYKPLDKINPSPAQANGEYIIKGNTNATIKNDHPTDAFIDNFDELGVDDDIFNLVDLIQHENIDNEIELELTNLANMEMVKETFISDHSNNCENNHLLVEDKNQNFERNQNSFNTNSTKTPFSTPTQNDDSNAIKNLNKEQTLIIPQQFTSLSSH